MSSNRTERIQNAIRHIKSSADIDPWAMELAVEALEKQIPQEPVYVAEDRYVKNMYAMFPQCPSCGYEIAPGDVFCLMCGQAIDRRKEDD